MAGWWAPLVARFIPVGPAAQPPPPLPANRATAPTLCPVTGSPRPAAGRHLSEWPDDQRTSRPPLSNAATRADALSGQGGCQRGRHAQPAAPPFHPRTAHVTAPGGGSARPLVLGTDRSAASLTMMQRRRRCSVTGVRGGGGFPPCSMDAQRRGAGKEAIAEHMGKGCAVGNPHESTAIEQSAHYANMRCTASRTRRVLLFEGYSVAQRVIRAVVGASARYVSCCRALHTPRRAQGRRGVAAARRATPLLPTDGRPPADQRTLVGGSRGLEWIGRPRGSSSSPIAC